MFSTNTIKAQVLAKENIKKFLVVQAYRITIEIIDAAGSGNRCQFDVPAKSTLAMAQPGEMFYITFRKRSDGAWVAVDARRLS